ncbi:hypothetical protein VQ056_05965 [Paenibacillus sp. JTLBN-2024]
MMIGCLFVAAESGAMDERPLVMSAYGLFPQVRCTPKNPADSFDESAGFFVR